MTTPLFYLSEPAGAVAAGDVDACLVPLQIALDWLSRINEWHFRRSLRQAEKGLATGILPPLYTSGVTYRPRPAGRQDWLDAPAVLQQRRGSAEDLVAWRTGELRASDIEAEPVVGHEWVKGVWRLRFMVRHPDGRLEDPARGVGGKGAELASSSPGHTPLVKLSLPDTDDGSHFVPLQIALEGLTKIDEWQIRRALQQAALGLGEPIPPLYASGVVYREEAPGREDWLDAQRVNEQGFADCEDLAAYRTAELRVAGQTDVEPVIKWQWIPREMMIAQGYPAAKLPGRGVWMVHCCVRHPDGSIEDPSKILGMGGNFTERI